VKTDFQVLKLKFMLALLSRLSNLFSKHYTLV